MLAVGAPADEYEQEADRVAEAMEHPASLHAGRRGVVPSAAGMPQRKAQDDDELHVTQEVQEQIDQQRGGGQPLAAPVRAFFEPRFGRDFGDVRVHTDADAARLAQSLGARAFTVGTDVTFAAGQYQPEASWGRRILAHELTHVVQQTGGAGAQVSGVVQRAGDPAAIPSGLRCSTDLTPGRPAGTDLLFTTGRATITPPHTAQLMAFVTTWQASGGTDDIVVHGFASTEGDQSANWTLSCDRAEAVRAELVRIGIPAVRISVIAHGESTDFSPSRDPNQRAVVTTQPAGLVQLPLVVGTLTARDNFAGRSPTRFGVGEVIDLGFLSLPPRPAADFGGLVWHLVSGGGILGSVTAAGTATYTAPAVAGAVQLELRVMAGATAGRVISNHTITVVQPSGVRMTAVPGTAPGFSPTGPIAAGTWGAGFQANPFIDPRDVSFRGVLFGEGTIPSVITPAGGFLSGFAAVHPVGPLVAGLGGNAATGTPVAGVDSIFTGSRGPARTVLGIPVCGAADFLWPIPWEFSVGGGPRTPFATANHHGTSTLLCDATIEKAGAGPFCRSIDGSVC